MPHNQWCNGGETGGVSALTAQFGHTVDAVLYDDDDDNDNGIVAIRTAHTCSASPTNCRKA